MPLNHKTKLNILTLSAHEKRGKEDLVYTVQEGTIILVSVACDWCSKPSKNHNFKCRFLRHAN